MLGFLTKSFSSILLTFKFKRSWHVSQGRGVSKFQAESAHVAVSPVFLGPRGLGTSLEPWDSGVGNDRLSNLEWAGSGPVPKRSPIQVNQPLGSCS